MRSLRQQERSLLKHLMQKGGIGSAGEQWFDAVVVADLDDGGMGSFRILEPSSRGYGHFDEQHESLQYLLLKAVSRAGSQVSDES